MATHSSILAWRIPMDTGALWATIHVITKRRMSRSGGAMQEKKGLGSPGRGRLRGFFELRRPWGFSPEARRGSKGDSRSAPGAKARGVRWGRAEHPLPRPKPSDPTSKERGSEVGQKRRAIKPHLEGWVQGSAMFRAPQVIPKAAKTVNHHFREDRKSVV